MTALPTSAPDSLAGRMVVLARAQADEAVCAMGARALDMVVDLCRSGFEHVICGCASGQRCAGEHSRVLLIDGPVPEAELASRLRAATPLVMEAATIVLCLSDVDQDARVVQLLAQAGLDVASTVYDLSHEVIVAHRVLRAEARSLAA